jgi:hypothetical protein
MFIHLFICSQPSDVVATPPKTETTEQATGGDTRNSSILEDNQRNESEETPVITGWVNEDRRILPMQESSRGNVNQSPHLDVNLQGSSTNVGINTESVDHGPEESYADGSMDVGSHVYPRTQGPENVAGKIEEGEQLVLGSSHCDGPPCIQSALDPGKPGDSVEIETYVHEAPPKQDIKMELIGIRIEKPSRSGKLEIKRKAPSSDPHVPLGPPAMREETTSAERSQWDIEEPHSNDDKLERSIKSRDTPGDLGPPDSGSGQRGELCPSGEDQACLQRSGSPRGPKDHAVDPSPREDELGQRLDSDLEGYRVEIKKSEDDGRNVQSGTVSVAQNEQTTRWAKPQPYGMSMRPVEKSQ